MRIGVDGYNLALPKGTGIATYGTQLVATLNAMGHEVDGVFGLGVPDDPAMRASAFFDGYRREAPARRKMGRWRRRAEALRALTGTQAHEVRLGDAIDLAAVPGGFPAFSRLYSADDLFYRAHRHFAWTGRFLSLSVAQPPEIMHWTYPVPVTLKGSRNIYTLHDLVPLKLPWTTLDDKQFYARLVGRCVRDAAQLCTVSEASLQDIVDRFRQAAGKIVNTYQIAADPEMPSDRADTDAALIESAFALGHRQYFLYYGAIEPKKNIGRLIEAYLRTGSATPLVIVGGIGWSSEAELRLIPGEGASGATGTFTTPSGQTIIRRDHLPRRLLGMLIRGAKAVVFPSLYEGFGLPVLEAMQLGTPVVTSNISALPEVAGEAALLVDPYKIESIADAMCGLDGNPALCADLSARGLAQAALFSRENYSARLTTLYDAAMRAHV